MNYANRRKLRVGDTLIVEHTEANEEDLLTE